MNQALGITGMVLLLAACGHGGADPAAATPSDAAPEFTPAAAQPAAPPPGTIDRAVLAEPCLLTPTQVSGALGVAIDTAEPEVMGDMAGCSYRGPKGSLRLNFIWHDPAYFALATQATRNTRPGEKIDLTGDPDKAWMQFDGPDGGNLHYYRKNVEVELVPLLTSPASRAATQAALLKLPRVP